MNANIIFRELETISELAINIQNEENRETVDLILDKVELIERYLI